jgi:SAM-dependent methyltransferase
MAPDEAPGPVVFDRAAGYYDETRGFPPGVDARVAALIAEAGALGRDSELLEIGIGTGRIALPLAAQVRRVLGVDLSRAMLAQLLAKRGDRRVQPVRADAAALPFPDACLDAVLGVHVFHLIPRWRDVLAEVARVLRPRGLLLHAADDQAAGGALGASPHALAAGIGHRNAGVPRERFETFPEEEGWRPVGGRHRIEFARRLAPQEILDRMAARAWSTTWRMSDAELAGVVAQLRERLLERFGRLDQPVDLPTGFGVRAYLVPP